MDINLSAVDAAVLVIYLLAVVGFGMWISRGPRSLSSYLVSGRDLSWWMILGSIVATETSTVTFLSVPGLAFNPDGGNLCFLQIAMGYIVGRCLVVWILLPLYFRGSIYSAYKVLETRFGGATRTVASAAFLVTRNLGDGLRLYLTAIVLDEVTGLPLPYCVLVIGIGTILYTLVGGMKSVVWNDNIQFVVYLFGGLIAGATILWKLPEGWNGFLEFASGNEKLTLFNFERDISNPFTFYAGLIGGMFLTFGTHGTDQMMVQRYLCAKSQWHASVAIILSGIAVFLQFGLFLLLGVGLAAYYDAHPPEIAFEANDRVFASFIVTEMQAGVGIIGIVLAAVFSAAMSTLSSSLNSSATAVVNDFIVGQRENPPSDNVLLSLTKLFTALFGIIQIGIAIGASYVSKSVISDALAIAGFSAGLLLGIFLLGVLTKRVGQRAALCGFVAGLLWLIGIKFVLPWLSTRSFEFVWQENLYFVRFDNLPSMAWPWLPVVGSLSTFVFGYGASFVFHKR